MKIAVAPDSFKESLSALEATRAIARGLRRAAPDAEIVEAPMADGGEGTVDALVDATRGRRVTIDATDPLGGRTRATFGLLGDGETAVIEMAAASGLPLVPPNRRNPLRTTTRGTGDLLRAALDEGASRIIIGIGGSATVDGGAGMAAALGVRLLDGVGRPIGPGGGALADLERIDLDDLDPRVCRASILVACDVTNPLTGPDGAARVYGPQKGATPAMVEALDANLAHLAKVIRRDLGRDVADLPGAGAAGGLGAGLVAFLGAELRPGIDIVAETLRLDERFAGCDLVFTGEGRLDGQSACGKVAVGVARAAQAAGAPVILLAGSLGDGCEKILSRGVTAFFGIIPAPASLDEALAAAAVNLERTAEQALRAVLARETRPAARRAHTVVDLSRER